MPRELEVFVGDIALHPYRLANLLTLPWVIGLLLSRPIRISSIDYIAAFTAIWHGIALVVTEGIAVSIDKGFALGADFALAYLVGRATIRTLDDFQRYITYLAPVVFIIGLTILAESMSQKTIVRPFFAELVGAPALPVDREIRLGLGRGMGPFPHPILGGAFLASIIPLFWYAARTKATRTIGVLGGMMFLFTVSSTAYLSFLIVAALAALLLIQRATFAPALKLGLFATVLLWTLLEVGTDNGAVSYIGQYLLDSQTTSYRKLIWTYGGNEVSNHPWFGIGIRDWSRPSFMVTTSVDAHWLLIAMRHGIPAAMGFLLSLLVAAYVVVRHSASSQKEANVQYGIAFALIALAVSGISVALWDGISIFSVMLAGIAVSVASRPVLMPSRISIPQRRGEQAR